MGLFSWGRAASCHLQSISVVLFYYKLFGTYFFEMILTHIRKSKISESSLRPKISYSNVKDKITGGTKIICHHDVS